MNISEILIITSIISGLVSIPFLVLGPFDDHKPTGKVLLGLGNSSLEQIQASFSKIITSDKFEKTYETAFGKFWYSITSYKVEQKLSRPDRSVEV